MTPGEASGLLRRGACIVHPRPFEAFREGGYGQAQDLTSLFPPSVGHFLCPHSINTGKDISQGPPGFFKWGQWEIK